MLAQDFDWIVMLCSTSEKAFLSLGLFVSYCLISLLSFRSCMSTDDNSLIVEYSDDSLKFSYRELTNNSLQLKSSQIIIVKCAGNSL